MDNQELNEEILEEVEAEVMNEEEAEVEAQNASEAELAQKEDQILRLSAEIANMTRRNTIDRQNAAKYRAQSLAQALLPVVDNLERALDQEVANEESLNLKKGVEMVYNSFIQALEAEDIKVINPLNEQFDPNFHQAVTVSPLADGIEEGQITTVLQKGFILKDRVLRPAMVIVAQ